MAVPTFSRQPFSSAGPPWASRALALVVALCATLPYEALTAERFWADSATGLAIGGFDPVSFFTQAEAKHGSSEYEHVWHDASWRFSNEANLAAFKRDPEIYAPRFGGLAAVSLARGYRTAGNPRVWHISDGRLYLFYSMEYRSQWLEETEMLRAQAVEHWEKFTR